MNLEVYFIFPSSFIQSPLDSGWAWFGSLRRGGTRQLLSESLAALLGFWASRMQASPHLPELRPAPVAVSSCLWAPSDKWRWWSRGPKKQMLHTGSFWLVHLRLNDEISGFLGANTLMINFTAEPNSLYSSTEDCPCKWEAIASFRNMSLKSQPVK